MVFDVFMFLRFDFFVGVCLNFVENFLFLVNVDVDEDVVVVIIVMEDDNVLMEIIWVEFCD